MMRNLDATQGNDLQLNSADIRLSVIHCLAGASKLYALMPVQ